MILFIVNQKTNTPAFASRSKSLFKKSKHSLVMQLFFSYLTKHFSGFLAGKTILIAVVVIGIFSACKKNHQEVLAVDCNGPAKSFANEVNPIIQSTCATTSGCHGSGSTNGPGPLLNYAQVFNARSGIRSEVASGDMPKNGSLTTSQKTAIICWIDNGAPNN
jgi:hypothetical protein